MKDETKQEERQENQSDKNETIDKTKTDVDKKTEDVPNSNDVSIIDEVKKLNEENKKLLESITAERKKIEKATAEAILSGKTYMTEKQKEQTEEERYIESAKKRYEGLGISPI